MGMGMPLFLCVTLEVIVFKRATGKFRVLYWKNDKGQVFTLHNLACFYGTSLFYRFILSFRAFKALCIEALIALES